MGKISRLALDSHGSILVSTARNLLNRGKVNMEQKGITARVSAFARAFHSENNEVKIFDDSVAKKILTEEEYMETAKHMEDGILYFNPAFQGEKKEALRWIVDHVLSATPLARAAFAENELKQAVGAGVTQYLICAAGFDTFAYRKPQWANDIKIFELDYPTTSKEKRERLKKAEISVPEQVDFLEVDFSKKDWQSVLKENKDYQPNELSFCSFLGMVYYLSKIDFERFLQVISGMLSKGSSIIFDYPNEHYFDIQTKHAALAKASNEAMQACYSEEEINGLLEKYQFKIVKDLDAEKMTEEYFAAYNQANPDHTMKAQENVNYCLAVKKS